MPADIAREHKYIHKPETRSSDIVDLSHVSTLRILNDIYTVHVVAGRVKRISKASRTA